MKKKIKRILQGVKRAAYHALLEALEERPLKDFEYLIHHIETEKGVEKIHHCFLYDHIGNLFKQSHLIIDKNGKATLDGKAIEDEFFHVIVGLEETQEVVWIDTEAKDAGIKPKAMRAGMTKKQKAKEW